MLKIILVSLMICGSLAERISSEESPTWPRRTTEGYGFGSSGRDRSPSFEGDETVRSSFDRATDSPRRFTHTWDAPATRRSSYLDRFTTQRPYSSSYDRDDYDRFSYGSYASSRRPSYQTDRWGDPIGGERTTYSPYISGRHTTDRWGLGGSESVRDDRDRTSAWGGLDGRTTRNPYGSSIADRDDDDSYGFGTGSLGAGRRRDSFDRSNAYIRIEADLIKLYNDQGLTSSGERCDTYGSCDTVCYGYIDTERPNAGLPPSRDPRHWPLLSESRDNNSPSFTNANVARDVCGAPYRGAIFRVHCEDKDNVKANDLIDEFDCNIQRDPEGETFATWHSGECTPRFQADKTRLTFRYKIYTISRSRCDPTTGAVLVAGGTTARTTRRRRS